MVYAGSRVQGRFDLIPYAVLLLKGEVLWCAQLVFCIFLMAPGLGKGIGCHAPYSMFENHQDRDHRPHITRTVTLVVADIH